MNEYIKNERINIVSKFKYIHLRWVEAAQAVGSWAEKQRVLSSVGELSSRGSCQNTKVPLSKALKPKRLT